VSIRLVGVVVASVVLAGCAGATPVTPGAGPESPVSSTPGPSTPGPTALKVTPRPGLIDVRPQAWEGAELDGPRKLRIEFYGGVEECEGVDRVEVEESPDRVTVSLYVGRVPDAEVCIEIAVLKAVTVRVDAPIGGREIVDGGRGDLSKHLVD
jgi:hypothetical protein